MVRAEEADSILSTGPSFTYGGRYNRPGEFGALYLSETPEICEQEKLKQVGGRRQLLPPQALGFVDVDIRDVLDLTDEDNRKALGVSAQHVTDLLDMALPQAIADAARDLGVRALLVPSAATAGKNLVVFEESLLQPECKLRATKIQKPFT
jgi:RES domain-containing protein